MKTTRRQPARSAAQVAMSKTNPAESEEATGHPGPRVISGPPRFDQQPGAIGSVCKHCGQSIREHVEGFCNPNDATQHFAEQELEAEQAAGMFRDEGFEHTPITEEQPQVRVRQHPGPLIINKRAAAKIQIIGEEENFTPYGERIGVVDQALELLNILPDCPEREMLARRCALMIGGQLQILGYTVAEEERENEDDQHED